jgi:hypothetical protein
LHFFSHKLMRLFSKLRRKFSYAFSLRA